MIILNVLAFFKKTVALWLIHILVERIPCFDINELAFLTHPLCYHF